MPIILVCEIEILRYKNVPVTFPLSYKNVMFECSLNVQNVQFFRRCIDVLVWL